MNKPKTFYIGSNEEVAHHAAPLQNQFDVELVEPDEILNDASPGDLAIFYSEHFDRFRDVIPKLRNKKVATLYAVDGILEWRNAWENRVDEPACPWTMRPVLSDKVACIGHSQARVLSTWGNAEKIEIVGAARLEGFSIPLEPKPLPSRQKGEFRPLIMTAKWPGFTEKQMQNAERSLLDLKTFFEANPEIDGRKVKPIWRITHGLEKKVGVKNELRDLSGQELNSVLAQSDAVVTTPSTAILEGMLHGLPVAALEYNNCPQYVQTVWQINAEDHIENVINELANPDPRKLQFQMHLLKDHLQIEHSPTQRMKKLVSAMHNAARDCVENNKPLCFPSNILEPSGSAVPFSHSAMYPDESAFESNDLEILQAELAQARRRYDQVKSELAQAHEILFSIERHPVAGPIVRMRRKIQNFFGSFRRPRINQVNLNE